MTAIGLPLSTLAVLDGDRGPSAAIEWANDLLSSGQTDELIVDLALLDQWEKCDRLLPKALALFGLDTLNSLDKARLARTLLTRALTDEALTPYEFVRRA